VNDQPGHEPHLQCAGEAGERRAICRTLGYWTELKGDRPMPLVEDVNLNKHVPDLAAYVFIVRWVDGAQNSVLEWCGEKVTALCGGRDPLGIPLAKVFPYPLGDNLPYLIKNVVEYAKPISNTGTCRLSAAQKEAYYRTMLLPLTLDGARVDRVLGVVGFRLVGK
jgi:hypothetical protein